MVAAGATLKGDALFTIGWLVCWGRAIDIVEVETLLGVTLPETVELGVLSKIVEFQALPM